MVNRQKEDLIQKFRNFFEIYESIPAQYLNLKDNEPQNIVEAYKLLDRLKQEEFPVAFFGSFSAGKSTIINAILGDSILPEKTYSTTAVPTYVRKGAEDQAIVYYLNHEARLELRGLLLKELGSQLKETLALPRETSELSTFWQDLDQKISNLKQDNHNFDSNKVYEKLKSLCVKGDDFIQEGKTIKISELKNYTEDSGETLFIDRIEVYLSSISLDDDLVLADLPGLGVVNPRHIKITKNFITDKAKGFVVCMHPCHVLEGEDLTFLDEINKSNTKILQRSFWVINKWDEASREQKIQADNHFKDKQRKYGFDINKERCFKVSALKFLLFKQIDEGKTESETELLRGHGDKVAKDSPDEKQEVVRDFTAFKEELFDYLNQTAREEFLKEAKGQLTTLCRTVIKALPDPQPLGNQEQRLARVVYRESQNYTEKLKNKVRDWMKQVRNYENFSLWQQKYQKELEEHIDTLGSSNRQEIFNQLRTGIDVQLRLSHLPSIIEKELRFNQEVRSQLVNAAREGFTEKLNLLILELREIKQDYFSQEILDALKDKLNERDITMRLYGLADYLLYDYNKTLDNIALNLQSPTASLDELVNNALQKYREGLKIYADDLKDRINKYMAVAIKNHAEYLEKELIDLFDKMQESITGQITESANFSKEIEREQEKQSLIKDSSDKLNNILTQL